jgi:hypothetical protein
VSPAQRLVELAAVDQLKHVPDAHEARSVQVVERQLV